MSFAHTKIQQPRPRAGLLLARPALERALVSALAGHRAVLLCIAAADVGACAAAVFRRGDGASGCSLGVAGEHLGGEQMANR